MWIFTHLPWILDHVDTDKSCSAGVKHKEKVRIESCEMFILKVFYPNCEGEDGVVHGEGGDEVPGEHQELRDGAPTRGVPGVQPDLWSLSSPRHQSCKKA